MALGLPPFLYVWADRATIADTLQRLRAAIPKLSPDHPAVPAAVTAARRIDRWLAQHPEQPEQQPSDPGPVTWNNEITPDLAATWDQIEPLPR